MSESMNILKQITKNLLIFRFIDKKDAAEKAVHKKLNVINSKIALFKSSNNIYKLIRIRA